MTAGRPIGSMVRQNIVEILHFMKRAHGYDLYKVYLDLFPHVSLRLIYYHLKKGVDTHEFVVEKVENEKGDYSWGETAEKIYYALGNQANPIILPQVKKYFEKKKQLH
ncbi:hypothetical protein ACFLTH_14460 [Bacteroidota bacterium]